MAIPKAGLALAAAFVSTGMSTTSEASNGTPLTYTSTFRLQYESGGPDVAGLDGATVTQTVVFDAGVRWTAADVASHFAPASSATTTISGASHAETNGARASIIGAGLLYSPGSEALWTDNLAGGDYPTITGLAGGQTLSLGTSLEAVASWAEPLPGDGVKITNFGALRASGFSIFYTSNNAFYSINPNTPATSSATGGPTATIPEPAVAGLIGVSVFVLRRRCR
jgi:hypothetical protein